MQTTQDRLNESEGKKKGMAKKSQTTKGRLNEAEGKARDKKLTQAMERKLMEHSKTHSSKHMRKMRMVMVKEGRTFAAAHKIALAHDNKKNKK